MQDWYLITPNTRPNLTGGYENDAYNDYKDDEFAEILDTLLLRLNYVTLIYQKERLSDVWFKIMILIPH